MTLNNKDNEVRQYKINNIFDFHKDENNNIIEIKNIFYDKKFYNIKFQNIYEKLGKTIKNYIYLKTRKEDNLEDDYKSKIRFFENKIIAYFNKNKKDDVSLTLDGISELIKLSFNILYTKEEIMNLLDYINFKYFDVKKLNDKYQIICLFPFVEEILKNIYLLFIIFDNKHLNYSLEKIFNSKVIKGGGKQYLFQEIIINNLESNISKQNFVPDLTINEQITLPKLITKQNGVNLPFIYKKIQLNENMFI